MYMTFFRLSVLEYFELWLSSAGVDFYMDVWIQKCDTVKFKIRHFEISEWTNSQSAMKNLLRPKNQNSIRKTK